MLKSKKRIYWGALVVGIILSWNNTLLGLLNLIERPDRSIIALHWGYDLSGALAMVGMVIALTALIKIIKKQRLG